MSRRSVKRNLALFVLGLALAGGFVAYRFSEKLQPTAPGEPRLVRLEAKQELTTVLRDLEQRGIIRSAAATGLFARYKKIAPSVEAGTYSLAPGMKAEEVFRALKNPIVIKVTVPEYYWLSRTAELMEQKNVATAEDYTTEAQKPEGFAKEVSFPLPKSSLEGYLFPDTYKMQPLSGARAAIKQQLVTFEKKVWEALGRPKNLNKAVIIGSMVEREAKLDRERPIIAGVIENRLAKGMALEIDATVLYAKQRWHVPTRADLRNTISPYNTYLNKGLPPGPICSPGVKSIEAALKPAKHNYLYYVALPDGSSLFAATYPEHLANINRRRQALKAASR